MRRLSIALVVLVASCGGDEPRSDGFAQTDLFPWIMDYGNPYGCSTTCLMGCCQNEICMNGTEANACGSGGMACQNCSILGQQCVGQMCSSTQQCSPSTCSGCCNTMGCQSGNSVEACGAGGADCQSCESATEDCIQNTCKPKTGGSYKVILVSLIVNSAVAACSEGSCDPYVVVTAGSQNGTSSTKPDNNSPVWNEELFTATQEEITSSFHVVVYDEDITWDAKIGDCNLSITAQDVQSGSYTQADCPVDYGFDEVKNLTFNFDPAQ